MSSPDEYQPGWRDLGTLSLGTLLTTCGLLPRVVETYHYEWHLMLGHAIDPEAERVKHMWGCIPNSLVHNLLSVV